MDIVSVLSIQKVHNNSHWNIFCEIHVCNHKRSFREPSSPPLFILLIVHFLNQGWDGKFWPGSNKSSAFSKAITFCSKYKTWIFTPSHINSHVGTYTYKFISFLWFSNRRVNILIKDSHQQMHRYTHTHTRTHIHTQHAHIHVYMHIHTSWTYTCTCTHTHIYAYTPIQMQHKYKTSHLRTFCFFSFTTLDHGFLFGGHEITCMLVGHMRYDESTHYILVVRHFSGFKISAIQQWVLEWASIASMAFIITRVKGCTKYT